MGFYLNSQTAYTLFKNQWLKPYFVDKTEILEELIPLIGEGSNYICITRPRRFGKTVNANLIASFLSKGCESSDIFNRLAIANADDYKKHLNQYNVIHITFNEVPRRCRSYEQYISRIEGILLQDLKEIYPDIVLNGEEAVWDVLTRIYASDHLIRFVFVLDEWDYIFHRSFVTVEDKKAYIEFLSNLLKDKPYVSLAYMTGILPIAKYSSGSELNMFYEYTMVSEEKFSGYFGFTEKEIDVLFDRFLKCNGESAKVTRDGLRIWYDGYHTKAGERVYNPRSVIASLTNNNLGNYWTSAGPYDEIFYYIEKNITDVRDDLALMISGIPVPAKVREYAATSMNLTTKDEIFSAMVVYGFLNYEDGCVSIPNKELMDKFADMIQKEPDLGYVYQLARESGRMLSATKAGDTQTMVEILEHTHNTESPLLYYSDETELTMVFNMVYLEARDSYYVEREDKAGIGYADFIFYPQKKEDDCIIIELKVDHTAKEAVEQIKDRSYALKFQGKLGEKSPYTGRILAVGIAYDKKTKHHSCRVEVL